MRSVLACVVLTAVWPEPSRAHRLDEYLQATLLGVTGRGIEVEIRLTPGVAVLPLVLAMMDRDRDGRVSPEEERAYAGLVAREVELRVDGVPAPLTLLESAFPDVATMQAGLGTILLRLRTERTGHGLRFENRHLPQISAYLVNCLAAPAERLQIGPQQRDEAQRSMQFEYSFGPGTPTARRPGGWGWLVAAGILLLGRAAVLMCRGQPSGEAHRF